MSCPICHREQSQFGMCQRCHLSITEQLNEIYEFWNAAHLELTPGNGGQGSSSGERTIGLNVQALSYITGSDILGVLHEWEKIIRSEQMLTPPALVLRLPLADEVAAAINFAKVHLTWCGTQPWAAEYASEIRHLWMMGSQAARNFVEKTKRIPCPAEMEDGKPCGQIVKLYSSQMMEIVECRKCHSQWTAIRLIAVALSNNSKQIMLDAEAIAEYLGIEPKSVATFAKRHNVQKINNLYNFSQIVAIRKTLT